MPELVYGTDLYNLSALEEILNVESIKFRETLTDNADGNPEQRFSMTKKYKSYTDDDVVEAVKLSKSIAGVIRKLGLVPAGGNYDSIKRKIAKLNLDTSHFTGKIWAKNDRLKDWSEYKNANSLRKHLVADRGHKCEMCNLSEWLSRPITLEIHHIDGKRYNNDYTNIQLLCPNCHSLTKNWRRRK